MGGVARKSGLTPNGQRLVSLMQRLNFGRIVGLSVRAGDPVFDPPPRIERHVRIGGDNGARPELAKEDFALHAHVRLFFEVVRKVGTGVIGTVVVQRGLPADVIIVEDAAV